MIYLIRGPQGSGKSTIAKWLYKNNYVDAIVEIDDFWTDHFGNYKFDKEKLEDAHRWVKWKIASLIRDNNIDICIPEVFDKINILRQYVVLASGYKHRTLIYRARKNLSNIELANLNLHGVKENRIKEIIDGWEEYPAEIVWNWENPHSNIVERVWNDIHVF